MDELKDGKMSLSVLQFVLQNVSMCIDLKFISKVLPLMYLEVVPGSPQYLVGLMNLAGESIPVIDLATRVGISRNTSYTLDHSVLLCSDGKHKLGIVVDKIIGLIPIEEKDLQMRDEFHDPNSPYLASISFDNDTSLLLNMDRVLSITLSSQKNDLGINLNL